VQVNRIKNKIRVQVENERVPKKRRFYNASRLDQVDLCNSWDLLSCAFEAAIVVVAAYFLLQRIVNVGRLAAAAAAITLAAASSSSKSDIIHSRGT
jgi:hypothetical protein